MMTSRRCHFLPRRARRRALAAGLAACLGAAASAGGAVIYVDDDAAPGGDGSSWSAAFDRLQVALSLAQAGDEIWVAAGTYRPALPYGDRMASFELIEGVALYGGFAGWETSRDQRDWLANETILSGDLAADDGPDFANNDENSYHVVAAPEAAAGAILDGFVITAGNADVPVEPNYYNEWTVGGGLYVNYGGPTITRCAFRDNWARYGGALYARGGAPILDGCEFVGNVAQYRGGAIRMRYDGILTITGSSFRGNFSNSTGGAIAIQSGGSLSVTECEFIDNHNSGAGGGAIAGSDGVTIQIESSTFRGNGGGGGAGVFLHDCGSADLTSCAFVENQAGGESGAGGVGGGFAASGSEPISLVNCLFSRNTSNFAGGAAVIAAPATLINCTFFGNQCTGPEAGGAIYVGGGYPYYEITADLYNSILWGNIPDQIRTDSGGLVLASSSNIQGGWSGPNNIDADPLFLQPNLDDLRLGLGSPCLDAGDDSYVPPGVTTDLAGNPRIQNGTVDMGAYEGAFEPLPPADGEDDLDQGEIVLLIPEGGEFEPLVNPAAFIANMTGPDNASVLVTQLEDNANSNAGGYTELSWILEVDTTLADGQLFAQLMIAFTADDLDGADPLELDLTVFDPIAGRWALAVAANTVNSPGHDTPVGDRFAAEGDTLPPFSNQLGDYGVFFNPSTGQGLVWANLDHAGDFAAGIALCLGDIGAPADDVVDTFDLIALLDAWGPSDTPGGEPADLNGDGAVNILDLLVLFDHWGACP